MSAYIKLLTLEYPRHEGDIRLEHSDILESQTGDSFICPETYSFVILTRKPQFDPAISKCIEGAPEQIEGVWYSTWVIVPFTQQELDYMVEHQDLFGGLLSNPGSAPNVIE
jgi:hypothetical protein